MGDFNHNVIKQCNKAFRGELVSCIQLIQMLHAGALVYQTSDELERNKRESQEADLL